MIWVVALLGLIAGGATATAATWVVFNHASTPH